MFFQSWHDFWQMGGYGFYVWLSYGISLLTLGGLIINSYRGKRAILRNLRREQTREEKLKNFAAGDK